MNIKHPHAWKYNVSDIEETLSSFVEDELNDAQRSDQIHEVRAKIDKITAFLGRLTEKLVEKEALTLEDVRISLSYHQDLKEVKNEG